MTLLFFHIIHNEFCFNLKNRSFEYFLLCFSWNHMKINLKIGILVGVISIFLPKCLSVINKVSTPFTIRLLETTQLFEFSERSENHTLTDQNEEKIIQIGLPGVVHLSNLYNEKLIINRKCLENMFRFKLIFLLFFYEYMWYFWVI